MGSRTSNWMRPSRLRSLQKAAAGPRIFSLLSGAGAGAGVWVGVAGVSGVSGGGAPECLGGLPDWVAPPPRGLVTISRSFHVQGHMDVAVTITITAEAHSSFCACLLES